MGVCLCKDKIEDEFDNNSTSDPYTLTAGNGTNGSSSRYQLSDRVDSLVRETLHVIAQIVDE